MVILTAGVQFLISAVVIVLAGTVLTKRADVIAERTGLGRMVIGSVLLGGATSLPELTVDISAIRLGAPDLAVGDLFGSCLANLLILAVLDLLVHSSGGMLSRRAARHALSGTMSGALIAIAGLTLLTAPATGGRTFLGIGSGLWILGIVYLGGLRILFLDQKALRMESAAAEEPTAHDMMTLKSALIGFVCAATAIVITGPFMAHAAEQLANATGLGKTFVGTTMVALCTSLPEFVASLTAVRMGSYDLAIANVFGSNAFNMLLLVPLDLVQPGSLMAVVSAGHSITCLSAIVATQTVIIGQLFNMESRRRLIDVDAWLVVVIVLTGLALVYFTQ